MFGFAKQELYIIAFLILSLLVGVSVKRYRENSGERVVNTPPGFVEQFSSKVQEIDSLKAVAKKGESSQQLKRETVVAEPTNPARSKIKININEASAAELQKVPKIGPVLANKIIEYRLQNGNFSKIEDMINVKGIGKKTLNKIKDYLILK